MKDPKILFFDIETAPILGYAWQMWDTDLMGLKNNFYILSFAFKWNGDKKIQTVALPDFSLYQKNKEDDRMLVAALWALINEADILVAHNGDKFDIKKSNARFLFHKLAPPAPYKTVDTLKVAKRYFKFDSNKLDSLCKELGIGSKLPHTGAHLWFGCMSGDEKSWTIMRKYNAHDVFLLEEVYLRLRPWMTNHPNVNVYDEIAGACPTCGGKKLQKRGFSVTGLGKKQRYQCSCGAWSHGSVIRTDLHIRP